MAEMRMHDIKAALVGTGFMAPVHTEALRRLGVEVVGVLGSSKEKSRRAASALGIPKAYRTYDELTQDKSISAVHITSPNLAHFEQASQALLAGKHVLCEKPLAMNAAESGRLVEIAKQTGLVAGVNYNIRYYPNCIEARERVRHGELGEVVSIQGSYVQDWLAHPTDYNWRVLSEQGGVMRAVADVGTHWLDLVQMITGQRIAKVCADLRTVHETRYRPSGEVETFSGKVATVDTSIPVAITTDDTACVMFRFENGAQGVMWVSQVTVGRKNRVQFEIGGSKATYAWDSQSPSDLWVGYRDRPNEHVLRDPGLASPATRRYIDYPGGHNEGYPDSFKMCFRAFYNYILAGDPNAVPDYPTFEDGHREIQLCDAIYRSHQAGRWIVVE